MAARVRPRAVVAILLVLLAAGAVILRAPLVDAGGDLIFGGPRARHVWRLRATGRMRAPAAQAWAAAGRAALASPRADALPVALPVDAGTPADSALGLAVDLRRGQRLDVSVRTGAALGRVFIELFDTGDGHPARWPTGTAVTPAALSHEVTRDGRHVLRVQGELGASGSIAIEARAGPSLTFPVAGATASAMRSAFGVGREGGRRRHDGVDIFAPRGTRVLSASAGVVTSVGENRLGGLVVWVWNPSRGLMLYYAHLDSQVARVGQRVARGDVLGTVGTTGNARTTPPHLHFGIYSGTEGAIDPDPFIREAAAGGE